MPAVDIKIDQTTRDIVFVNGELQLVRGITAGAQRIYDKLHTFTGEWFLNLLFGIPYKRDIMIKAPQLPIVSAILQEEILDSADPGSRMRRFDLTIDEETRILDVQGAVQFPGEEGPTDITQIVGN